MELEKEFAKYVSYHKYETIAIALIKCEKEGIYNEWLLRDYRNCGLEGKKKAFYVAKDLYARQFNGEENLYNSVYEMCWGRMIYRVEDRKSLRIGVNYDED